jgi:hypothetical protein
LDPAMMASCDEGRPYLGENGADDSVGQKLFRQLAES